MSFILKAAACPYWLNMDPSYPYLFNSLNLVNGLSPAHVDHPGTPLQVIGFLVIWSMNLGSNANDVIHKVISDPELYLRSISTVLIFGFSFMSAWFALYVYKKTGDKIAAVLTQLPIINFLVLKSWGSMEAIIPVVANVDPEPLLISIMLLFNLFFFKLFLSKDQKEDWASVLFLGLICGLGVAAKLTFLPILLLPLMIIKWRMKVFFIFVSLISFIVCTLPIVSFYPRFWKWAVALTTHTGQYGQGKEGLVDISKYFSTWWSGIVKPYWFLMMLVVTSLVLSAIKIFKKQDQKETRFLFVIACGIMLQFALVAKQYNPHYLLPGISLFSGLFLFFYLDQLSKVERVKKIILIFIVVFVVQGIGTAFIYRNSLENLKMRTIAFYRNLRVNYPQCMFIGFYGQPAAAPDHAVLYGNQWSLHGEEQQVCDLFPHSLFFDKFLYHIESCNRRILADDVLKVMPCTIFIGSEFDFSKGPFKVKLLAEGPFALRAYGLAGSDEKQATSLFLSAQEAYNKGEYEQAFSLALKSRELKFQPEKAIDIFLTQVYRMLKK
ncbi:MAG: hypothetical protein HQL25_01165 [Candidatus Omnitrophica bacterium]|nr:hypothetical protein [Candidatus Omnitrophota bacterium]